ncbi:MAG: hypothetical protein HY077_15240 [Elusimicrobia bacterium]|nr:hypothetical protein [Elusimicrobiota bacterium]
MLTADQEERLAARWLGEALREIAILVLVFVPLDWFLGQHEDKLPVALVSFSIAALVFAVGTKVGLRGEIDQG